MKTSDAGIKLIEGFEGLRLHAYKPVITEKYWTIGYGHYGADVAEGMSITQEQAEAYLQTDLAEAEAAVSKYCTAFSPNQNQFDALVSFTFNCGAGNLKKLLAGRSAAEVAAAMPLYCHAGGKVLRGLVNRRAAEVELFNTPVGRSTTAADSVIEKAVTWMIAIANDDTHGYDQAHRWGVDYDCSALVISAYEQAGVTVKEAGASYTGNMKAAFEARGFVDVISQIDLATGSGCQRGDVLLNEGHHTAIYVGAGQIVHASINEKGTVTGGQTGDQTGREICVRSYYNRPWTSVLRYQGAAAPTPAPAPAPTVPSFTIGRVYTLQAEMKVRTGASTKFSAKKHSQLTPDGQRHDRDGDGCLEAGTRVTCLEVSTVGSDVWIRTPSGWIAAYYNGKTFMK
jgi:GH24 family phage-related lysozyme (muramidase)